MKKLKFNRSWEFSFERDLDAMNGFGFDKYSDAIGAPARFYDYNNWKKLDLPHDWAVAMPKDLRTNTFAGARAVSHYHRFMTERHTAEDVEICNVGWYRKQFAYDPAWEGKRIFLAFEGIFRDAVIWVNGVYMDRHTSGYTEFFLEMTDHLVPGEINSVAVRVDADQPEGWWYEGAGIYRNVWLWIGEETYFRHHSTVVKAETNGDVRVTTTLVNDTDQASADVMVWEILDADGRIVASEQTTAELQPFSEYTADGLLTVVNPRLWCLDDPYLYRLHLRYGAEEEDLTFGIRSIAFDPDRGFLLNGEPCKLHGACVHQDFGGVGTALPDNLQYYKIRRLKEMGVNAYRCAHHAPSPVLLDACDALGMLVMDETRLFGTSPEAQRQLTSLIERDRNHPSVMLWSLGNEEFTVQNQPWSYRLMEKMTCLAKRLDDTRPVTYGGNNAYNTDGANGAAEVRGVNYIRNHGGWGGTWIDRYHALHPEQPMVGSEEGSAVMSRGGAQTELGYGLLDSFGDVTMPWASTPKGWVQYAEERPYFSGGFLWTGFDYRGEPNPFITTHISSSFGAMDLCGMEKPPFHYYRAQWVDEPVLKAAPHWNHPDNTTVRIAVLTNCTSVTLSVNGREIETRTVNRFDLPIFTVPFERGELTVTGVRQGKTVVDRLITSGNTAKIRCSPVLIGSDDEDISIYQLDAFDENGNFCPTASETVVLSVTNGEIIGVGNGDPACLDDEQKQTEEEAFQIRTFSCEEGLYSVPAKVGNHPRTRYDWIAEEPRQESFCDDFRTVAFFADDRLPPRTCRYTARFERASAYQYVEFERLGSVSEIFLNGKKIGDTAHKHGRMPCNAIRPYRFYADFAEGENLLTVVSERYEHDDPPISGSVRIGRTLERTPWQVRLHYGRARVFVKSRTPDVVRLTAVHTDR